jgi:hypothetical protein
MTEWYPRVAGVQDNGFGGSRNGQSINGVVIHHVAGTNGLNYVANANTRNSHPTYHIATSGAVTGIVHPDRRPYSTGGQPDPNAVTFEIDNSSVGGDWPVSAESVEALIDVIVYHASQSPRAGQGFALNDKARAQSEFFIAWHKQYSATACPGPFLVSQLDYIVSECNRRASGSTAPVSPAPTPVLTSIETLAREVIAGKWGNGPTRVQRLTEAGHDARAVQAVVNQILSGKVPTPAPAPAPAPVQPSAPSAESIAREVIAGKWGNGPTRVQRLTQAGYDAKAVQSMVNQILSGKAPAAPAAPVVNVIDKIAREVIAGKWGNGPTRVQRLNAAGHNARAVQSRVNEILAGR